MADESLVPPVAPYKYLDHYGLGDHRIFRGREREIRALSTDITVNRLVVLFAETGSGKTSLINAGVRPRLEEWRNGARPPMKERAFATYHIRVKEDPAESIRTELADLASVRALAGGAPLASALRTAMRELGRPVVLFLDQFEEFFLYREPGWAERRQRFIDDVAELYDDEESGVHLVFSMREEFLGKMDAFREKIPSIFHRDSQLRLGWFGPEQAREAIVKPAQEFGVEMDDALVDAVLRDLGTEDGVEPAQLQIVCDSLWYARGGGARLTLEHYRRLAEARDEVEVAGLADLEGSFARRVLGRRFEESLKALEAKPVLDTLAALLPELCSESRTKRIRDLSGLQSTPGIDGALLPEVVDHLVRSRLVQRQEREGVTYVELAHDYLVERMPALRLRVRTLRARRLLAGATSAYRRDAALPLPEAVEEIGEREAELAVTREQTRLLFEAALEWGLELSRWFDLAVQQQVPVWDILEAAIASDDPERAHVAQSALAFLAAHRPEQGRSLLEDALSRPVVAPLAIDALGSVRTLWAVDLLTGLMYEERYATEALDSLRALSRVRDPDVAAAAREGLEAHRTTRTATGPTDDKVFAGDRGRGDPRGAAHAGPPAAEPGLPYRDRSSMGSPPMDYIAKLLRAGTLIPFLGAGTNAGKERLQATSWYPGAPFLPNGYELARALAHEIAFPDDDEQGDLVRVASYYQEMLGGYVLRNRLREVFDREYEPAPIHRFLASSPEPLLILTTNADTVLERAFDEAGREYDVVTHVLHAPEASNAVLHWRHGRSEPEITSPNQLMVDLNRTSVIYKLGGSVHRSHPEYDSFILTEDDYVELLAALVGDQLIPAVFRQHLRSRPLLFLGIGLDQWFMRVLVRSIWDRHSRAWAILARPSPVTAALWESRGVKVYDMWIEEFLDRLRSASPE